MASQLTVVQPSSLKVFGIDLELNSKPKTNVGIDVACNLMECFGFGFNSSILFDYLG